MWCASEMKRQRSEDEACTRSSIFKIQIKLGFFFHFLVCQKKPDRWFFNLRHTLQFGIGLHHAGLNDKDRSLVEEQDSGISVLPLYPDTPGIWTKEQVEAWKPIVDAVHMVIYRLEKI
ncbi:unnamed protein product [Prunus armeniaca]